MKTQSLFMKLSKFKMADIFFVLCVVATVYCLHLQFTVAQVVSRLYETKYQSNWKSLDTRPMPKWYPRAKFGIFIHWGLFSVPGVGRGAEQFWGNWLNPGHEEKQIQKRKYMQTFLPPKFKFQDFAPDFKAEFYKPREWAKLFQSAGARYVVLTAKHHDGYVMWPSKHSWNWNSVDTGPGRDLVGELKKAIDETGIHFGLYNSLMEWFHPKYENDMKNNFSTTSFVQEKLLPEMKEMVEKYKPEVIFSDGDWFPLHHRYWKSLEFLTWLFNESPVKETVVVNDRWGAKSCWCKHGSYFTCGDSSLFGTLQPFFWENALKIDSSSWGFRRDTNLFHFAHIKNLIKTFIQTISCGGNLLLNVAPSPSGVIAPIYEERLRQMGEWLAVNEEAVYSSEPWKVAQNDSDAEGVWYTRNGDVIYAFFADWPDSNTIHLGSAEPNEYTNVTMLGLFDWEMKWKKQDVGMTIGLPFVTINQLPSFWAWVLKIEHLENCCQYPLTYSID